MKEAFRPINCDGCSACCMGLASPPFDDGEDDDAIYNGMPEALRNDYEAKCDALYKPEGGFRPGVFPPGVISLPCFWLDIDAKRCRHYEHRPATCRQFTVGCDQCVDFRTE